MEKIIILSGLVLSTFILILGLLMLIHPPDNMKGGPISPGLLGLLCISYAIFRVWKSLQMLKRLKNQNEE